MPVIIPQDLPATEQLAKENIFFMKESQAIHQDIRPMEIAIINPGYPHRAWETGLIRKLSYYPIQLKVDLISTPGKMPSEWNEHEDYLRLFRRDFHDFRGKRYDGLIVTERNRNIGPGAGFKNGLDEELWQQYSTCGASVFFMGGAAVSALQHYYELPVHAGETGAEHMNCYITNPASELTRGFDDIFKVSAEGLMCIDGPIAEQAGMLEVLVQAEDGRICLISSKDRKFVFCRGENPRSSSSLQGSYIQLLLMNWLNYYVYQAVTVHVPLKEHRFREKK